MQTRQRFSLEKKTCIKALPDMQQKFKRLEITGNPPHYLVCYGLHYLNQTIYFKKIMTSDLYRCQNNWKNI